MVMVVVSLLGPLASRSFSWSSQQLPAGSRSAEGVQPPEGAVGPRWALLCRRAGQDLGPLCLWVLGTPGQAVAAGWPLGGRTAQGRPTWVLILALPLLAT